MSNTLEWRWIRLCGELRISHRSEESYQALYQAWHQDHRYYHTVHHLIDGLDVLDRIEASPITKLAFWWHDFVYRPTNPHNEGNSAGAFSDMMGEKEGYIPSYDELTTTDEVRRLIMVTKDHRVDWWDKRAAEIVVADLHGLGADPETYAKNTVNIRKEFWKYTDEEWIVGRRKFLEGMVERGRIFPPTPTYNDLNWQAQMNIRGELAALEGRGVPGG